MENVKFDNNLGSMRTNDARCKSEIKFRFVVAKAPFNKKMAPFTSKVDLYLGKKLVNWYIWSIALCGAATCMLRKVDQKYLESIEMWCWRSMEKIGWTDRVRNDV